MYRFENEPELVDFQTFQQKHRALRRRLAFQRMAICGAMLIASLFAMGLITPWASISVVTFAWLLGWNAFEWRHDRA